MQAWPQAMKSPRCFEGMVSAKTVVTIGMQEPTPSPAISRKAAKNARSFENACGKVKKP